MSARVKTILLHSKALKLLVASLFAWRLMVFYDEQHHVSDENLDYFLIAVLFVLAIAVVAGGMTLYQFVRPDPVEGYCRNCGYDLRATPDRCPECGAVPGEKRSE